VNTEAKRAAYAVVAHLIRVRLAQPIDPAMAAELEKIRAAMEAAAAVPPTAPAVTLQAVKP